MPTKRAQVLDMLAEIDRLARCVRTLADFDQGLAEAQRKSLERGRPLRSEELQQTSKVLERLREMKRGAGTQIRKRAKSEPMSSAEEFIELLRRYLTK